MADQSDGSFSLTDKAPAVFISTPEDNTIVYADAPLVLRGLALDPEEGRVTGDSLEWRSDRNGFLGTGEVLELAGNSLSDGEHQLTFSARDSAGHTSSVTHHLTIQRLIVPALTIVSGPADGLLTLEAFGSSPSRLFVETSSDLDHWTPLLDQPQLNAYELAFDFTATDSPRFYRARSAALAPILTQNDPTNLVGFPGTNFTLQVTAVGQGPLQYQWYINNTPLTDSTNATLLLSNLQPSQSGNYFVIVSNIAGVVTGATAAVSIITSPFQVLHAFGPSTAEGTNGWGKLAVASDGSIYGCVRNGGRDNAGAIFKFNPATSNYTVLRVLTAGTDGMTPLGGIIEASDGGLYGTTFSGGSNNAGTVFRLNKDGSSFRVLRHFASSNDCRNPQAELLEAADGLLYGTAYNGGGFGRGGVFRLQKDGSGYETLTGFGAGAPEDPRQPIGGLIQGLDGFFYGTSESGGSSNKGCIFRLGTNGAYTVLKSLGLVQGGAVNPNGTLLQIPSSALLIGTSANGGTNGFGTIFTIAPDGSDFRVVYNFGALANDGRNPTTGLTRTPDGKLLGTTRIGGTANQGVIYQMNSIFSGIAILQHFTGASGDSARSRSPLAYDGKGFFYSTTFGGGINDQGTLFRYFLP